MPNGRVDNSTNLPYAACMAETISVHINIDRDLKTWLWVKAAEQGKRPARVIEEAIRIMKEYSDDAKP